MGSAGRALPRLYTALQDEVWAAAARGCAAATWQGLLSCQLIRAIARLRKCEKPASLLPPSWPSAGMGLCQQRRWGVLHCPPPNKVLREAKGGRQCTLPRMLAVQWRSCCGTAGLSRPRWRPYTPTAQVWG